MNVLKVFDDFRQLDYSDQQKIVEWFNENGKREVRVDNTPAKVAVSVPMVKKADRMFTPKPFSEQQLDFIDFHLHSKEFSWNVATMCADKWPNERSRDAWLTTVNKRKRDMKARGEL